MTLQRWLFNLMSSDPWETAIEAAIEAAARAQAEFGDAPVDREEILEGTRFVDMYEAAKRAKYASGRSKRDRYPRVDLSKRKVVITLHQMGFERRNPSNRWHLVTAHANVVRDDAAPYVARLHPADVRLVAANALDRSPWHSYNIEIEGNYRRRPGSDYWNGDRMGRSVLDVEMRNAARAAVVDGIEQVAAAGGEVVAVMPHCVSGRTKTSSGKMVPNRQGCPGFEIWREVGEWAARELGLALPGPGFELGGVPVHESWHGEHWRGGEGLTLL